jgi:dTMP kinase
MFIVCEGIDGSGKSHHAKRLGSYFNSNGMESIVTYEPTHGRYGIEIRNSHDSSLIREIELFENDRYEHINNVIKPALSTGKFVVCDRYYHSTVVYQGIKCGRAFDILRDSENKYIQPDILLLFDVQASIAHSRIIKRDGKLDKYEKTAINLEKMRMLYLEIFGSKRNTIIIDSSGSTDEVFELIKSKLHIER